MCSYDREEGQGDHEDHVDPLAAHAGWNYAKHSVKPLLKIVLRGENSKQLFSNYSRKQLLNLISKTIDNRFI